jgi:hypothetical protein
MNRQSRNQGGTFSRETQRGGTLEGSRDRDGNTTTREGTYTGPEGETIDYSTSRTRTEDGISRTGSFETSTGASGGGSAEVKLGQDGFESAERSRHIETADGETGTREISSERDGDWVVREGEIETSTGIDAESAGAIKKTDDGFIARGAIEGDDYAAVGTIVKDGDDFYVRGAATDGDEVTWGRAHCDGGDRVRIVQINSYRLDPVPVLIHHWGHRFRVTHGSINLLNTIVQKRFENSHTDTPVGSGNQGRLFFYIEFGAHNVSVVASVKGLTAIQTPEIG